MKNTDVYSIHPSIGIGRLGNSTSSFYLAPESIGDLPIEADEHGNPVIVDGNPKYVTEFKDAQGCIKRQAAKFRIYKNVDGKQVPIEPGSFAKIERTVHVANKKAAWWNYVPLLGDLMFGPYNSYQTWENTPEAWGLKNRSWTQLRNAGVEKGQRQKLIIDPGSRTLCTPNDKTSFNAADAPIDYKFTSFPDPDSITQGLPVKTLGEMRTDSQCNLLVTGAYGRAGG